MEKIALLLFLSMAMSERRICHKALKTDVFETLTTNRIHCTSYTADCESCTKGFGQYHNGNSYECVWNIKKKQCHSKKQKRGNDEWIQSHPLGAFCPSYKGRVSVTMSSSLGQNLFPSWLGALPEGTKFKYALLRHETSTNLFGKGLGLRHNAGLNTYQGIYPKGKEDPTNIARVTALSNMFKGFKLLATQKSLSVDVSPVRRALQTLEVTLNHELLIDITKKFPIRVDALLRENSGANSGAPGSTEETIQIFCDMFSDMPATISMEKLIKSSTKTTASSPISASSLVSSRPSSTELVCPAVSLIVHPTSNKMVENRTFTFKREFGREYKVGFEEGHKLGKEETELADLRALYLSKFVALLEKEGTLFIGHGRMFRDVMRKLWEENKAAVAKFNGILDSKRTDVRHLDYGESYLLLDVKGVGEMWFIINREGVVVRQ